MENQSYMSMTVVCMSVNELEWIELIFILSCFCFQVIILFAFILPGTRKLY